MFSTADTEENAQVTSIIEKSPTTTSDAQESTQNTQVAKQQNKEITLNMLVKELVICIALALTTYGALRNTPNKISKHPQAQRFFSTESLVTDWYRGQLSKALAAVNRVDIAFVMYYAPWDAECQYVRGEFENAAYVLSDRVQFSAINCWHPGSECRLQHNKIPSWPVIMAYTVNSRGVLYKGPKDAHSMVKFLELLMTPLRRVSSAEDLVNLLSICDTVAVGYTPLVDTPKYYNIWNGVAMQSREYDTVGEICFASVTSEELAADLGVEVVPSIRFMLWNETKEYKGDASQGWNETSILPWLFKHFSQPVERVIPLWKKAFTFERYANGNPILMLFTPMNPLYEQIPIYSLLREIAMEYYNCHNNQWIKELIKLQQIQRLLYEQKNVLKFCQEYKLKQSMKKPNKNYEILSHHNKYPWTNSTAKNQKNLFDFLLKRRLAISSVLSDSHDQTVLPPVNIIQECTNKMLPAEKYYYENYEQCHAFDDVSQYEKKLIDILETTMLPVMDDPLSADQLFQDHIRHYCRITKFAYERGAPVLPARDSLHNVPPVHALGCVANHTLNMVAIDSVRNYHFAESLGIDIVNRKDKTALIILDSKHESQYILSEDFSAKSVREYILNFTNKKLKRMLRARVEDARHTHFFESDSKVAATVDDEDSVQIVDLTTSTFRKFVKTRGVVSIVCVCGGACGAGVARGALGAARLLRRCGVRARVARLDALRHDLPWHFTVQHHPTVFVFPAHRMGEAEGEADSLVYPRTQRVSAGGLVALALRSLPTPQHLRVRRALCALQQGQQEKKTCLKDLKQHVTTLIGRNLEYWRKLEDKHSKEIIFKRLQSLHRVSFELGLLDVTDIYEDCSRQKLLIDSLSILAKHWDVNSVLLKRNITQSVKRSSL